MKNEKKITVALLIVYLLVLSWIILFKLQFSFSALDHIRAVSYTHLTLPTTLDSFWWFSYCKWKS